MKTVDFVPFDRPLDQPAVAPRTEGAVNHLCACLRSAFQRQHKDTLEYGRTDGDPHVEHFAERILRDLDAVHVGVAKTGGELWAYVVHRGGVDLLRLELQQDEQRGNILRGVERRFRAPGWIDYRETLIDFAPEIESAMRQGKAYALPNAEDDARYGYSVSVVGPGLDEPVTLLVKPADVEAFLPLRNLLRSWATRSRGRLGARHAGTSLVDGGRPPTERPPADAPPAGAPERG